MTVTPIKPRDRSRDKALLVAIAYSPSTHPEVVELLQTHNDLERLRKHLIDHWRYLPENITVMKDDNTTSEELIPTRKNILREIDLLVKDVQKGDRRVFFFAGHCYQIKNRSGTEEDKLDEVILTARHNGPPNSDVDYHHDHPIREGIVIDNELRESLVDRIPRGAKLVAIADTCHSGTLFDLDYHWHGTESSFKTLPSPGLDGPQCENHGEKRVASPTLETPPRKKGKQAGGPWSREEHLVFHTEKVLSGSRDGDPSESPARPMFIHPSTILEPAESGHSSEQPGEKTWLDRPCCASPTVERQADVMSLCSSEDSQQTWARENESMTAILVDILESLHHKEIKTRDLTKRLNRKLRDARRSVIQSVLSSQGVTGSRCTTAIKKSDRKQYPQIGALCKKTPYKVFEF